MKKEDKIKFCEAIGIISEYIFLSPDRKGIKGTVSLYLSLSYINNVDSFNDHFIYSGPTNGLSVNYPTIIFFNFPIGSDNIKYNEAMAVANNFQGYLWSELSLNKFKKEYGYYKDYRSPCNNQTVDLWEFEGDYISQINPHKVNIKLEEIIYMQEVEKDIVTICDDVEKKFEYSSCIKTNRFNSSSGYLFSKLSPQELMKSFDDEYKEISNQVPIDNRFDIMDL